MTSSLAHTMPTSSPDAFIEQGYRKGVGIILAQKGKVLVCERSDRSGAWQFPQGGVDDGEDLLLAARRELFEETGLVREQMELIAVHGGWTAYDIPDEYLNQKRKFKGAVQKWFLFHFKDDPKSIDLSKAEDKEFKNHKWTTPKQVIKDIVPFRKEVYKEVLSSFDSEIEGTR